MPLVITQGFGSPGLGADSELVVTQGFGGGGVNPSCHAFDLSALNVFQFRLDLVFTTDIALTPFAQMPSNWSILNVGGGVPMNITGVSVSGHVVSLVVTEGTAGLLYRLNIPVVGITDLVNNPYAGPYIQDFFPVSPGPAIQLAFAPDGLQVRCIFTVPVVMAEATIAANYVITGSGGLTVISVIQDSANSVLLNTTLQIPGASYTLTASNIHDVFGNLI